MQFPIEVEKYLKKFLLPGWNIETSLNHPVNLVVVIPAICEYNNIRKLIESLLENDETYFDETLILFVINNSIESSVEIKNDNLKSIRLIRTIIGEAISDDSLILKCRNTKLNFGLVDASTSGKELPTKDAGVGLARKIGMDLSLSLFNYSSLNKKILLCLDADCTVSENYLSEIYKQFNNKNFSAVNITFEHPLDGKAEEYAAIVCYELFLRYYVLGLQYAKSPYAFHTIGSSMACDYLSYIKIGGMNKKKAAEDFYFIEKLAKVTEIKQIEFARVYPSPRGSWRVPFGTGQRVNRYHSKTHDEYLVYSHQSFVVLKHWLEIFLDKKIYDEIYYLDNAKRISHALFDFLVQQKFQEDWKTILTNSPSDAQVSKQKNLWFDGFKTLKLIHYLRDNEFPMEPMFCEIDNLLSKMNYSYDLDRITDIPPIDDQERYLNLLRKFN